MKNAIALTLVLLSTASAFARSPVYRPPKPASAQKISNHEVQITLFGDGAQQLYDALEVEAKFEFGFVQTWTKETKAVTCTRGILGDVPGQMSGPNYHCKIIESLK